MIRIAALATAAAVAALALPAAFARAERAVPIPAPAQDVRSAAGPQVAVLAGGCYWGMEDRKSVV